MWLPEYLETSARSTTLLCCYISFSHIRHRPKISLFVSSLSLTCSLEQFLLEPYKQRKSLSQSFKCKTFYSMRKVIVKSRYKEYGKIWNQPLLRSTPSQCRPGLIPYRFGAASKPLFNQLWFGISWGTTKPDSFIFSPSPKFWRTGSGYFFCANDNWHKKNISEPIKLLHLTCPAVKVV